jgi:hypothetical protein
VARTPAKRNYSAERARRNDIARSLGYSSADALSKARSRGEAPTRSQLRKDPSLAERTRIRRDEEDMQRFVASRDKERTRANARIHDNEAAAWSAAHSRQKVTKFNPRWSAAKKERYYQTFVKPWGQQRTQQQRSAYGLWMEDYDAEFDNEDDPYGLS